MSFRTVGDADEGASPDDSVFSLIDRHTTVDGNLQTSYDLRVDGQVLGTLVCRGTLYVSEGASVDATIEAGNIVVAGTASGTIRCSGRMEIQASGVVKAEVTTVALVITEGAVFEGQIQMEAPPERSTSEQAPVISAADAESDQSYSFLRRFSDAGDEPRSDEPDLPEAPDDSDR